MFLRLSVLLLMYVSAYAEDGSVLQNSQVTSNAPEYIARSIFVGPDEDMPIDGRWRMSILPSIENGKIHIPSSLHEAFIELEIMLPKWYQAALYSSVGDHECFISINYLTLHIDVMSWLWVNWRLKERDSELRKSLETMGAEHRDQVLFGIHDGFCFYLKYGEEKALELLALPADAWGQRTLPALECAECEGE